MAAALVALAECAALDAGAVSLAAVIDEEMESLGAERSSARACAPTARSSASRPATGSALGHKGLEWLEVELPGARRTAARRRPASTPSSAAARFMASVQDELVPRLLRARAIRCSARRRINFGTIRGGDQPSTVAARCTLTLDRRTVPGENFESVCRELDRPARARRAALARSPTRPSGACRAAWPRSMHVALVTDPSQPLATAAARPRARRPRRGRRAFAAFPAWTDGALLSGYGADSDDRPRPRRSLARALAARVGAGRRDRRSRADLRPRPRSPSAPEREDP